MLVSESFEFEGTNPSAEDIAKAVVERCPDALSSECLSHDMDLSDGETRKSMELGTGATKGDSLTFCNATVHFREGHIIIYQDSTRSSIDVDRFCSADCYQRALGVIEALGGRRVKWRKGKPVRDE